ncbi:putative porin precursor [Prochlorococcus sp. MIT 0604]|nr:putative porin precursor [Prochlorococcus sp. MIT 0604]
MLVAGATLSLIAPMAAQASDIVNIEEMNSYTRSKKTSSRLDSNTFINEVSEDLAKIKGRIDGLEAKQNNFEAGSFNDTTTLDGKVVMAIGAVDGGDNLGSNGTEVVQAAFVYQMNLNTSFTGDDNLYVRLKAGDGWDGAFDQKTSTYHIEAKETGLTDGSTNFKVDKMWYTFPIGDKFTATVGPAIENYYMLAATPSVYKPGALKAFKLGGNGAAFGASTSTGAGLKYVADNGFAVSTTVNSKDAAGTNGFLTNEDNNKINVQTAYTKDNYHLSATYSRQQGWNAWSYYATKDLYTGADALTVDSDSVALRAWWRPDETGTATPSVSVGYDTMSFSGRSDIAEGSGYFVGFNWADMFQPSDKIGIAFGQPMKATKAVAGATLSEVDPFLWEIYYSFRPNDSIEVTPAIFGGSDVEETTEDDIFGAVLSTTFKF